MHLFFPRGLEDDAGGDIDYVTKERFEQKVAELRTKLRNETVPGENRSLS